MAVYMTHMCGPFVCHFTAHPYCFQIPLDLLSFSKQRFEFSMSDLLEVFYNLELVLELMVFIHAVDIKNYFQNRSANQKGHEKGLQRNIY